MRHESLETGDLQKYTERDRKQRGRLDTPSVEKRRGGEGVEMVLGVEEVGDHVGVASSLG